MRRQTYFLWCSVRPVKAACEEDPEERIWHSDDEPVVGQINETENKITNSNVNENKFKIGLFVQLVDKIWSLCELIIIQFARWWWYTVSHYYSSVQYNTNTVASKAKK